MLEAFGDEIWLASGPVVTVAGFAYPTRMAVIRLSEEELVIWSPVALTDAVRTAVDALGTVRWLVAPNTLHDRYLTAWQAAYPSAALLGPRRLRNQRADLRFDGDPADVPREWSGELEACAVPGNAITVEVVLYHVRSRTILFTDLLQQFDAGCFSGWRALVARLDGMIGDVPQVPRKFRIAFFRRRAARAAVARIVAWPAKRLVMAHGAPVRTDAQAVVRRAFAWLLR